MIKWLKVKWIYYRFRIKRFFFGKNYQTIKDCQTEWKCKNKSDIIRELIRLTGIINKNVPYVTKEYKKGLRKQSKKLLIKALIELKLQSQFRL